jgi:hypothetical protein
MSVELTAAEQRVLAVIGQLGLLRIEANTLDRGGRQLEADRLRMAVDAIEVAMNNGETSGASTDHYGATDHQVVEYPQTSIVLTNAEGYTFGRWPKGEGASGDHFGLAYNGHPTHMTYGTDYIHPDEMVARTRRTGSFWFDVGNDISCTAIEFERCMRHVNLLSRLP